MKHWALAEVSRIRRGASPRPISDPKWFASHGRGWIRISDVTGPGMILNHCSQYLSKEGEAKSIAVNPDDLVLTICATIGVPKIVGIPACIHDGFVVIDDYAATLDTKFLYYYLQSLTRSLSSGGQPGTQKNLNTGIVGKIRVPAMGLAEQRKIATILSTWDEALEKLDALITAKDRRKQALMQQLLTGKLRFSGFKGSAWKRLHMGDVLERVFRPMKFNGNDSLALVSIRRRSGGLFRRPDVLASQYKTQDLHAIRTGDFLISKRQVVHGAWAIVEPEFDGTLVSKEYVIFLNRAPEKLNMRFFAWLAKTPRMLRLARVASTGVHIEKLIFDPDVFLREQIRIPQEIEDQAAIAATLDTADNELRLLRRQREVLDHQKRGLMQRLLTGKIRVKIK